MTDKIIEVLKKFFKKRYHADEYIIDSLVENVVYVENKEDCCYQEFSKTVFFTKEDSEEKIYSKNFDKVVKDIYMYWKLGECYLNEAEVSRLITSFASAFQNKFPGVYTDEELISRLQDRVKTIMIFPSSLLKLSYYTHGNCYSLNKKMLSLESMDQDYFFYNYFITALTFYDSHNPGLQMALCEYATLILNGFNPHEEDSLLRVASALCNKYPDILIDFLKGKDLKESLTKYYSQMDAGGLIKMIDIMSDFTYKFEFKKAMEAANDLEEKIMTYKGK